MPCAIVLPLVILQITSWAVWMNFLTNPQEWDEKDRTKKNFILLLVPFGYWYFLYVGVKMLWKFIVKTYFGLK